MENKVSWTDILDPKFLGSWDIPANSTLVCKIIEAKQEDVVNFRNNAKERKLIVYLENQNPLVCNITNSKTISKIYKTKYLDEWKGKLIEIEVKQIRAFGETQDCLRVVNKIPVIKLPLLTKDNQHYESIKKAIADKTRTIEQIEAKYILTKEIKEDLICSK